MAGWEEGDGRDSHRTQRRTAFIRFEGFFLRFCTFKPTLGLSDPPAASDETQWAAMSLIPRN